MRKMKKLFIALAIAGASVGGAHAQSAVEIYGVVDMGFVAESGTTPTATTKVTPVNKLTSGVQSGTRLGFKGTENLGDGMKALFVLETGIAADAGGFNQGNTAFARQSFVGLQSDLGTLTLGRQYNPLFNTMLVADPFAAGMAGAAQNLMPTGGIRMNNTIKYASPVFAGFSTELAYGFGEAVDNSTRGQERSAAINYSEGDLRAALGYNDWTERVVNTATTPPTITYKPNRKDWFLAAN
jgi:predicted porin